MSVAKIFLNIVHFIVYLCSLVHRLTIIYTKSWFHPRSSHTHKQTEGSLRKDGKSLRKLPVHIGMVLVEDEFSYTDLAKIAAWCIFLGIPHITIYDRLGAVKQNQDIFYKEFQEHKRKMCPDSFSSTVNVQLHTSIDSRSNTSPELSPKNAVHIWLLSVQDGRQSLVKATRDISQSVRMQSMKLTDVEPLSVDHLLKEKSSFPDPDVVVRFGQTESLFGFMPWQIRLTEFLSLPSHRHIDYKSFYSVLELFAGTNQRFGK